VVREEFIFNSLSSSFTGNFKAQTLITATFLDEILSIFFLTEKKSDVTKMANIYEEAKSMTKNPAVATKISRETDFLNHNQVLFSHLDFKHSRMHMPLGNLDYKIQHSVYPLQ
jgi:hypothetical protein